MRYVFFIMLRAMPAWLRLTRAQRAAVIAEHVTPLLAKTPAMRMRYFDAEAFSAACSDVMMIETDDPKHHYFFMERLRDCVLLAEPLFEVAQIVPAIEDGYIDFEQAESITA